ncbi:hypothetical protein HYX04_05665 [Candidatus Woesearchaeota archaeon]|nr:hypothetical protein [Candidatus Woesearchaeota archaeon]
MVKGRKREIRKIDEPGTVESLIYDLIWHEPIWEVKFLDRDKAKEKTELELIISHLKGHLLRREGIPYKLNDDPKKFEVHSL